MSKAEPEALRDVDPLLAEYAAALHEQDSPTHEQAKATWAAVEAQTQSRSRVWLPIAIAVAAVLVGALLVGRFSSLRQSEQAPATEAPYQAGDQEEGGRAKPKNPEPVRSMPTPPPRPAPSRPEVEVEQPAPEPAAPAVEPRRPKPEPQATEPSSLAQETALLRKIQQARGAKQHARVLELPAEHAKRFPNGTFAAERVLARVRALCSVGRQVDARRARDRFVAKHPRSHLVPQFESACPD